MSRIDDILFRIEKISVIATASLMLGIVFLEVFVRYCFRGTLMVGIQEIASWSFVWLAAMACAAMVRRQGHILIEYFVKKLFKERVQDGIYIVTHLFVMFFLVSVVVTGYPFAIEQWQMKATSTDIPKTFIYLSIPVSMSFMFYHMVVQLISKAKSIRFDKEK
jgi:TRAP-type C4-dicarboxylate transport system permease small subunit